MTFMLNDPLIRSDEEIPPDAELEFRVVLSYDKIKVADYMDDGEEFITIGELLKRMVTGTDQHPSGDEQAAWARSEQLDYDVLDTSWYAAVDKPGELDRARFEWGWEAQSRQKIEAETTEERRHQLEAIAPSVTRARYRHPWSER